MFSLHPASQFYFPRLISHISVNSILTNNKFDEDKLLMFSFRYFIHFQSMP